MVDPGVIIPYNGDIGERASPAGRIMDVALALYRRLQTDEDAQKLSLAASGSASDTLPASRDLAHRLLLDATPTAIRTLRRVTESGSDKDAIAAANIILTKSPATRDESVVSQGASLSSDALKILMSGLANLATIATGARSAPQCDIPVDFEDVEGEDMILENLPAPDKQITAHGWAKAQSSAAPLKKKKPRSRPEPKA
jgi:hypothetical protein